MSGKPENEEIAKYQTKLAITTTVLIGSISVLVSDISQKITFEPVSKFLKESLIMGVVFCAFYILIVAFQLTNDSYHRKPRKIFTRAFEEVYYFLIVSLASFYAFVLFLTLSIFENGIRIVFFALFMFCVSFIASKRDNILQHLRRRKKQ